MKSILISNYNITFFPRRRVLSLINQPSSHFGVKPRKLSLNHYPLCHWGQEWNQNYHNHMPTWTFPFSEAHGLCMWSYQLVMLSPRDTHIPNSRKDSFYWKTQASCPNKTLAYSLISSKQKRFFRISVWVKVTLAFMYTIFSLDISYTLEFENNLH